MPDTLLDACIADQVRKYYGEEATPAFLNLVIAAVSAYNFGCYLPGFPKERFVAQMNHTLDSQEEIQGPPSQQDRRFNLTAENCRVACYHAKHFPELPREKYLAWISRAWDDGDASGRAATIYVPFTVGLVQHFAARLQQFGRHEGYLPATQ